MSMHIVFKDDCRFLGSDFGEITINYSQFYTELANFNPQHVIAVIKDNKALYGNYIPPKEEGKLEVILNKSARIKREWEQEIYISTNESRDYSIYKKHFKKEKISDLITLQKKEIEKIYLGNEIIWQTK